MSPGSLHDPALRARGLSFLRGVDPRLGALIDRHGDGWPGPPRRGAFAELVSIVVGQQLSVKAAATVARRVEAGLGGTPTPEGIASTGLADLRALGLSQRKAEYLKGLAAAVQAGALDPEGLVTRSEAEIAGALLPLRGIGPWSVEMFLIFYLGRPDVFSPGDLGLREAARRLFELELRPEGAALEVLAAPWRPYRTLACWYLWRSLENTPVGGEGR